MRIIQCKVLIIALTIYFQCSVNASCSAAGPGCMCSNSAQVGNKCPRDGSGYRYSESVSSTLRSITISGCPNHAFVDYNPNTAYRGSLTMNIPTLPMFISSNESDGTSLVAAGSVVGMLFDGSTVYSAYGGPSYGALNTDFSNSYSTSAPNGEGYSFDMCGQHSSGTEVGAWHSHVPPSCLLNQLGQKDTSMSPQLGWMLDGFPIYGPRGPGGVMLKRCSEPTANSTLCLDKCGGLRDASQKHWKDGFVYRYFFLGPYNGAMDLCSNDIWRSKTTGNFMSCGYKFPSSYYPFSPLCLRGCLPTGVTISNPSIQNSIPSCSAKTNVQGYTFSSAIPAVTAQLPIYTPPATCVSSECSNGYPNVGACVHNSTTGAYVFNATDDDDDYSDDDGSSTRKSYKRTLIIGVVVGVVGGIAFVALAYYCLYCKKGGSFCSSVPRGDIDYGKV